MEVDPELSEVKQLRKRAGLTQQQLAQAAGVSQSLIAKIEAGHVDPSFSVGKRILAALKSCEQEQEPTAKELMQTHVVQCKKEEPLARVIARMKKHGISAVPVVEDKRVVGLVSERGIIEQLGSITATTRVAEVMSDAPPIIPVQTPRSVLASLLQHFGLLIVGERGTCRGVVTKADLLGKL